MIDIAICFDNNIAEYASVLITSVLKSNESSIIRFHVFHDGTVSDTVISEIKRICSKNESLVEFYDLNQKLLLVPDNPYISKAAFLRLYIANSVDEEISKILYLDIDTIVLGDLTELYEIDLKGMPLAAVVDLYEYSTAVFNRIGFDFDKWGNNSYINSGVLLINVEMWREENYEKQLIGAYNSQDINLLSCPDQDIINRFFWGKILYLDVKYNFGTYFMIDYKKEDIRKKWWADIRKASNNPVIIHFAMGMKPWHRECHVPYTLVWRFFAKKCDAKIHYKRRYGLLYIVKRAIRVCGMTIGIMEEEPERSMYLPLHYEIERELLEHLR